MKKTNQERRVKRIKRSILDTSQQTRVLLPHQNVEICYLLDDQIKLISKQTEGNPGGCFKHLVKPNTYYQVIFEGSGVTNAKIWISDRHQKTLKLFPITDKSEQLIFSNGPRIELHIGICFSSAKVDDVCIIKDLTLIEIPYALIAKKKAKDTNPITEPPIIKQYPPITKPADPEQNNPTIIKQVDPTVKPDNCIKQVDPIVKPDNPIKQLIPDNKKSIVKKHHKSVKKHHKSIVKQDKSIKQLIPDNKKSIVKKQDKSIPSDTLIKNNMVDQIAIIIYTYDRYTLLNHLLKSIENNKLEELQIRVFIFDDASPRAQTYKESDFSFPIKYHRFRKNHGRPNWHLMISQIFQSFINCSDQFKYFLFTSDDMEFIPNGIQKAITLYQSITDPNKICLNIHRDRNPYSKWIDKKPKSVNSSMWKVHWMDMCFICESRFLRVFNYQIDVKSFNKIIKHKKYSSGVGKYLSITLSNKGLGLYLVKRSLIVHLGNRVSKMNPEERKKHKLISKL